MFQLLYKDLYMTGRVCACIEALLLFSFLFFPPERLAPFPLILSTCRIFFPMSLAMELGNQGVKAYLQGWAASHGIEEPARIDVLQFLRWKAGEGIESNSSPADFAEEVRRLQEGS
jgi:hypothetical protein